MKAVITAVVLLGLATQAFAQMPETDRLTKDQIFQKLHSLGYTHVVTLDVVRGQWQGDAVKQGKIYRVYIDPLTGALAKSEPRG